MFQRLYLGLDNRNIRGKVLKKCGGVPTNESYLDVSTSSEYESTTEEFNVRSSHRQTVEKLRIPPLNLDSSPGGSNSTSPSHDVDFVRAVHPIEASFIYDNQQGNTRSTQSLPECNGECVDESFPTEGTCLIPKKIPPSGTSEHLKMHFKSLSDRYLERTNSSPSGCVVHNNDYAESLNRVEPINSSQNATFLGETDTYYRRYWILFIFGFDTWFVCVQWNTWGSISASMIAAFPGWSEATVAMMENWFMLMYLISMAPVCWATGRLGLRRCMLISSSMSAIGLALRCITCKTPLFTIICHVSSMILGVSCTLLLSGPTMIAAEWFPKNERTTATAIILAAGHLGGLGSYLQPLIVRKPGAGIAIALIRKDVMNLMYLYAFIGFVLLLCVLVYFPSKPPLPPSPSSTVIRLGFKSGVRYIFRNYNLMFFMASYGIACGPSLAWLGVLNFSLEPLGFGQDDAMYVGLTAVVSICIATVLSGWLTDLVYGYLRETLIVLLLSSSAFYYWFFLLSYKYIPLQTWQVYLSVSGGLALNQACIPLFYDMASELAYPVPELLVGGFVAVFDCVVGIPFLFMYFNNMDMMWVCYSLVASSALPAVCLLYIKDGYHRSKLDLED